MKKFNKMFAAVVAVAMLLTMVPLSLAADETATTLTLSDIDYNTVVGKSVQELVKLEIINGYEDGTFRPDNTITRGEFAKIIIAFKRQTDVASESTPSGFADVDDINHWAKKYIKLAADQKIVNGYEDGTFRPDASVRYVEVVKMLVCALGYGAIAQERTPAGGTWYAGYMAIAAERGILNNASINNVEDNASRATVAVLAYNCLEVPTAQTSSTGTVTINDNKTALTDYLGKEKVTGIVTGVQQTGLSTGATGLTARQITVQVKNEENTYQVPKGQDTLAILGRKISGYTESGSFGDDDTISQITVDKQNSVVTVTPDMIDDVKSGGLTYYETEESNNTSSISFDSDMVVIYNGKYDDSFNTDEFLNVKSGKITFVSNNGDDNADVAFVESYEIFVVSSGENLSMQNGAPKIHCKYGASDVVIPYDDSSYIFSLTETGTSDDAETIIKGIKEWDVISIMRSKDTAQGKGIWTAIATTKKVSGSVTEVSSDTKKFIAKKEYDYAYNYAEYTGTKPELALNDYVTVYLDHEGKIAAALASTTESNIYAGYLIDAEKGKGVDGEAKVLLYGLTGTTKARELGFASTVRIDGVSLKSADAILEALENGSTAANAGKDTVSGEKISFTEYSQFIQYSTNAAGAIDMIDTVIANATKAETDLELKIAYPNAANERADKMYKYRSNNSKFVTDTDKLVVGVGSAKVLVVPFDVTATADYAIKTAGGAFSDAGRYRIDVFNVNEVDAAKYVITYRSSTATQGFTDDSVMVMTTELASGQNSETEIVDKVSGYNFRTGTAITNLETTASNMLINKVQKGDIFRYVSDDGAISETKLLLDVDGTNVKLYNTKGDNCLAPVETSDAASALRTFMIDDITRVPNDSRNRFLYGTAIGYASDTRTLLVSPTIKQDTCGIDEENRETLTIPTTAKVYLYDMTAKESDRIQVEASLDNIKTYRYFKNDTSVDPNNATQVLIYQYIGQVRAIIIFVYPTE